NNPTTSVDPLGLQSGLVLPLRRLTPPTNSTSVLDWWLYYMADAVTPKNALQASLSLPGPAMMTLPGTSACRLVRILRRGEKVADLVNELKTLTFQTGNEHALVRLASGERALVSGGEKGIAFAEGQISRLIAHTHGYQYAATGPSAADAAAISSLGQVSS